MGRIEHSSDNVPEHLERQKSLPGSGTHRREFQLQHLLDPLGKPGYMHQAGASCAGGTLNLHRHPRSPRGWMPGSNVSVLYYMGRDRRLRGRAEGAQPSLLVRAVQFQSLKALNSAFGHVTWPRPQGGEFLSAAGAQGVPHRGTHRFCPSV